MPSLDLELRLNGKLIPFKPGETIDLEKQCMGMICWHDTPIASAIRIINKEHQNCVNSAVESQKSKQKQQHGYGD